MKYIGLLFFFVFQLTQAQFTIKGTFIDSLPGVKSVALYKSVKGESNYINYVNVDKNTFTFSIDGLKSGNYRVLYKNEPTGYVDFIFNQENVAFELDSNVGQTSIDHRVSRENLLLFAYKVGLKGLQQKLDSVQISYFKEPTKKTIKKYKKIRESVEGAQDYYEELAKNDYCLSVIKASKRFNPPTPYTLPQEYIESIKNHFFTYVDFDDDKLKNSQFLRGRLVDYVFHLHQSNDKEQEDKLFIKAIENVMGLIKDPEVKEYLLVDMIERFINKENSAILPDVIALYKALPEGVQDSKVLVESTLISKTLLGAIPPNIKISKKETLYSLDTADKYLIVFWSSTCSHCRAELPKLDAFLGERKDVQVVSVGLEKQEDKQSWLNNTKFYPRWKNVIAYGKWDSIEATLYNIQQTPTYFILNKDKEIIAKPQTLEELTDELK